MIHLWSRGVTTTRASPPPPHTLVANREAKALVEVCVLLFGLVLPLAALQASAIHSGRQHSCGCCAAVLFSFALLCFAFIAFPSETHCSSRISDELPMCVCRPRSGLCVLFGTVGRRRFLLCSFDTPVSLPVHSCALSVLAWRHLDYPWPPQAPNINPLCY
jgi:hypothetical protein